MPIYNPLHPGEIVREILIEGAKLSITEAAEHLGVNRTTISRLINGHLGISPDMALRLSKLITNTDITLWMNLQRDYDIWLVSKHANKIHVLPLDQAA